MKLITTVIILILFLTSCDKCQDDFSCLPPIRFQYILVNTNEENLYIIDDNDYSEENLQIIGFKGIEELLLHSKLNRDKSIFFSVEESFDSIQVIYNNNHRDTFKAKNLKYSDFECCGTMVNNFDIEKNGQDFCTNCGVKTWTIQK